MGRNSLIRLLLLHRLTRVRQSHGRLHHLAQPLDGRKIALTESVRFSREQFKHPEHLIVVDDRHDNNRGNAQLTAHFTINPRVSLGVIATQGTLGAHTLTGKSKLGREQGS